MPADARDDRPDLVASDIPFSASGLSRSIVEDGADLAIYRQIAHEALRKLASLETQLRRAQATIGRLRSELRGTRGAR